MEPLKKFSVQSVGCHNDIRMQSSRKISNQMQDPHILAVF